MRRELGLSLIALLPGLLISSCSLAEDITPPPAVATAQMARPLATQEPVPVSQPPLTQPDLSSGATIYADRCAACHGLSGRGDGEMVASLPFPPTALADPDVAQNASPQRWYQVVTQGNLDRLMPPFSSLSDQQRWDVVGYALSLSFDPDQLAEGERLFDLHCSECHSPAAFDASYLQVSSLADISALIGDGLGSQMPSFAEELTQEQRAALAAYMRSEGWSVGEPPEQQEVAEELPASSGSIVGQISNGTPGAELPAGLEVTVLGFDAEQEVVRRTAPTDADGNFEIEDLEIVPGRLFFSTLDYRDVSYRSELAHVTGDGSPLDLSLTVYETMSDTSNLRVEQLHVLVDFPTQATMRVIELWVVGNYTDHVLTGDRLLEIDLPERATNLTFEQGTLGDRFELTTTGFFDREPIPPGSGIDQLVFAFELPRQRSVDFSQQVQHVVDSVTVLVPGDGPRLSGLQDQGVRDLGGFTMRSYAAQPLSAGDTLSFRVSSGSTDLGSQTPTLIGAAVLLATVLVVARSRFGRRPSVEQQPTTPQELLRAIARLDDAHQAGELSDQRWQRERQALKERALQAMRAADD